MGVGDSEAIAGTEVDDYDLLPYPSMPYPVTQPAHLAALLSLHGIDAPAV